MKQTWSPLMSSKKKQAEQPELDAQANERPENNDIDADSNSASVNEQQSEQPSTAGLSIEQLQQQLAESQAKVAEFKDAMLRAKAETENTKRRATIDVEKAHKHGNERFIKEFISVIDSVEHGLQIQSSSEDAAEGLKLIQKSMLNMLDKFGVEVLDPTGDKFDPSKHEAISMQPNNEVEPNTIIAVMQKGFSLHSKVIRAAKVVLASATEQA